MSLYSMRIIPNGFRIAKFDDNLWEVEATYDLKLIYNKLRCSCFQADRHTCKHREMFQEFVDRKAINKGEFYDYDNDQWFPPLVVYERPFVRRI